ncbi:MAG: phosphotriesterase family protein [bacterium]|jgi:phosphotriesterase-related protein
MSRIIPPISGFLLVFPLCLIVAADASEQFGNIMTVNGAIAPEDMGTTLVHEHVLVDFIGADEITPERYDREEAFNTILPHLQEVKALGVQTFIECTPGFIGRDPLLLQQLARKTGLHLLTNTGIYGAADDKFVPEQMHGESADSLAAQWIQEWENGIDGTGIKPGFIKIGVDPGDLSDVDEKLVRAAARTHLKTGLTIASHTGNGPAEQQIEILAREGVAHDAFVWVHAHGVQDTSRLVQAAERGAWISLDNVSASSIQRHLEALLALRKNNLLHRALLSHDAGWYHVGEPEGGKFRPYTALFHEFIPAMHEAGFSPGEIDQILKINPQQCFQIRIRKTETGIK